MVPTVGKTEIEQRLSRHERIALFFSGGKDSLACVYLLRDYWDRITIYHADSGDTLPEMDEVIDRIAALVPRFVRLKVNVPQWIRENGLPSDLLPYTAHPIGWLVDDVKTRLVPRYTCCFANLMLPLWMRAKVDGITMVIRGVKRSDTYFFPAGDGSIHQDVELYYPIQQWSDAQVMHYLHANGVKPSTLYDHLEHGLDCATCSAWWSEERGAYLKKFHPEKFAEYDARLQLVIDEIAAPLAALKREAGVK